MEKIKLGFYPTLWGVSTPQRSKDLIAKDKAIKLLEVNKRLES